jgi:hypothetical protein
MFELMGVPPTGAGGKDERMTTHPKGRDLPLAREMSPNDLAEQIEDATKYAKSLLSPYISTTRTMGLYSQQW